METRRPSYRKVNVILFLITAIELAILSAPISFRLYSIFKKGKISFDFTTNPFILLIFKVRTAAK